MKRINQENQFKAYKKSQLIESIGAFLLKTSITLNIKADAFITKDPIEFFDSRNELPPTLFSYFSITLINLSQSILTVFSIPDIL